MTEENSQLESILQSLLNGESLTPIDALNRFGCFRLGARIWDLRKMGYDIENIGEESRGKRYAKYRLKVELSPSYPQINLT